MNINEMHEICEEQGVTISALYNRLSRGWSEREVREGHRDNVSAYSKRTTILARYDLACGNTCFMVMLFDIIKSITKLNDVDNYLLVVGVWHKLIYRKESKLCIN